MAALIRITWENALLMAFFFYSLLATNQTKPLSLFFFLYALLFHLALEEAGPVG